MTAEEFTAQFPCIAVRMAIGIPTTVQHIDHVLTVIKNADGTFTTLEDVRLQP